MEKKAVSRTMLTLLLMGLLTLAFGIQQVNAFMQEVPSPTAANLKSVHMVDADDGWAVGGETAIRWDGSSWNVVSTPGGGDLQSVFMVSPDDGWAVGSHATIIRWDGSKWRTVETGFPPYKTTSMFYSVFFVDSSDGWAVGDGGSIIHWTGEEWVEVTSPVSSWLCSIFMVSSLNGWAVGGDRTLIHWNGSEWQTVESPVPYDLRSVFMLSSTDGWGVGIAGVIAHWDGTEWRQVESPLPEETGSNDLYSVFMLSHDDGWAVGPSWILHWDGFYWRKFPNPVDRTLTSVGMVASDDGWAVGYGGKIIHIAYVAPPPLPPEVWVDDDWKGSNPGDAVDGHIFGTDAFAKIQDGIDGVASPGTVYVAAGTYYENIFLKDHVRVQGADAKLTTIDGGGSDPVVTANDVGSDTVLDGFTITNGDNGIRSTCSTLFVSNCVVADNSADRYGGGICNEESSLTVVDCVFINNSAQYGGGISNQYSSSATVVRSAFINNKAKYGGGIQNYVSSIDVVNSIFAENSAYGWGGAIELSGSSATIKSSTFFGNFGGRSSYSLYVEASLATVNNSILWEYGNEINVISGGTAIVSYSDVGYPGEGNIDENPMFVDPENSDYHLQASSPCIDAGNNEDAPSNDFEGNPRPLDGDGDGIPIVDMGAYEFVPLPRTIGGLKTEIGKCWSEGEIDNSGIVKSLLAKLNVAQKLVDKGKIEEAQSILQDAFIPQVQNLSGICIAVEAADILVRSAEYILSNL